MTNELVPGREPLQIVEIVQPSCVHSYGVAPCTAEIGATGPTECFNTDRTCQDPLALDLSGRVVWRFVRPDDNRQMDLYAVEGNTLKLNPIPSLKGVSTVPTRINAGGGNRNAKALGNRASATIRFTNHRYDDTGSDPYVANRSYIATDRGTFWGKWLARNPYHNGWEVNVYDGYHGQSLDDMVKRTYLIDRINGPDASGDVDVLVNDPLRLADDQRSLCPPPVALQLRDAINDSQTAGVVIVGQDADVNAPVGDPTLTTYYLRVDDEIIAYTGSTESNPGEWTLTGVARSALGTEAEPHEAEEQVGRVAHWDARSLWKILEDLTSIYTPIPAIYTPFSQWEEEGLSFLSIYALTATVAEPTPVVDLLGELCQQSLSYLYWDDRNQTIPFRALRPPATQPVKITDFANIKGGTVQVTADPDQRISRVVVYYGQRNPTAGLDDVANYRSIEVRADLQAETQYQESRTRRIFSRWLRSDAQAQDLATRFLSRYRDNPRFMTLRLDAKDRSLWTADPVDVITREIEDETGGSPTTRWQVIAAEEIEPGHVVRYDLQTLEFFGRFGFYMAPDAPNYNATPPRDRNAPGVGFYADEDGLMADGTEGYKFQ